VLEGVLTNIKTGDSRQLDPVQFNLYLAHEIVPNLRSLLHDSDKVGAACNMIATNVVAPAFRQQKWVVCEQTDDRADMAILEILGEMTKLPSATKAWRIQIGDAFNDARFFKIRPEDSAIWRRLIHALLDSDKERLGDLLG
jgi:fructose-specific component phosphotransferase system IIB-like protein